MRERLAVAIVSGRGAAPVLLLVSLSLTAVACVAPSSAPSFQSDVTAPLPASGPAVTARQDRLDSTMDPLVADGSVGEADLEAALLATVACVNDDGFTMTASIDRREDAVIGYGADVIAGATEELADAADAAWTDCEGRFISPVFDLYRREHPIPAGTLERWRVEDRLHRVECLQDLGFEVDSEMTDEAIEESVDRMAFVTCSR